MRNLVVLLFVSCLFLVEAQAQSRNTTFIFNSSVTAVAGDVIYLQGSGFGATPHVQYSFNDSNWVNVVPMASNGQVAMVQLPANLARLPDLLTLEVSADGVTWSSPVYVNKARAYSLDTNQIAAGGTFRIFGRNLLFSRTPSVRLVDSGDGSSHPASVNTGASTSYSLTAAAPGDIKAGHTYSVYVSNGYNGNAASGGEVVADATLLGRSAGGDYWNLGVPWAADLNYTGNVYDIQSDSRLSQHADGKGSTGDANAINGAIWTASQAGGGIVYLPAGTYTLYFSNGCGVTLLPRVALVGEGASNTFINYGFGVAPTPAEGGWAACFGTTQAGISDITFNNVNQSGHWPQSGVASGGNEVFLQRTNWNIANAQWVVMQHDTNMTVQNSTIIQDVDPSFNGPFNIQGCSNFVVRGNKIQYVAGALEFDETTDGVFEKNTVIRDASQKVPASVITHVIVGNFANNLMLLGNSFNVTGGTLPRSNDGETMGSESGGATRYDEFRGAVQAAGSNFITDDSQNFNFSMNNAIPYLRAGAVLAIVSGPEAGEWATVTSVSSDGHTVHINQPWPVVPTAGSAYASFDWGAANWIIAGNTLANNEKGIEFFDASIRDILIANNSLTNNGEILISPTEQPYGAGLFNLVVNTQILDNTIVDSNSLRPAAISVVPREDKQNGNFGTSVIGLEVRGNSITGSIPNTIYSDTSLDDSKALTEGINLYWQWQTIGNFVDIGTPAILASVVQSNTLTNSAVGFELDTGDSETILAFNTTNNVGRLVADVSLPGVAHASIETVIPSSSSPVTSGSPAPPLPSPTPSTPAPTAPTPTAPTPTAPTPTAPAPTSPTPTAPAPTVPAPTSRGTQVTVFGSAGSWTTEQVPSAALKAISFPGAGITPVMGDYDGDGLVDCATYSNGNFHIRPSSNPNMTFVVYFADPDDVAVAGDYDGDGKTDIAVFRPSTGQWFYSPSSHPGSPNVAIQTGALSSDIPLTGDYDGDGKTDIAYYRPSTGTFFQIFSSNPGVTFKSPFALPGDLPVVGDYDGDGMTDLAVYRPSTGTWYYRPSSNKNVVLPQASSGQPGDIPVPGDYDGDGRTDFAVWRPSTRTWYLILSSNPGVTISVPMNGLTGLLTPLSLTPNAIAVKPSLTIN